METEKERICSEVDALSEVLFSISIFLKENPETAFLEKKACAYLSSILEKHGFNVEKEIGGLETAFMGRPKGLLPKRPAVAFLAEYDALPKIGHGCGHNLIAAASVGAAIVSRRILAENAGSLVIVGTPAEEGGGGKVRLLETGIFDTTDAAMMFHPKDRNFYGRENLGRIAFKMEFFGKSAHASSSPDRGRNALDALVMAYTGMNSLRQHLKSDGRIHGIITSGGDAPNVIPDYAAGLFYVRAASRSYQDDLFERVKRCAQGAAHATGTEVKIEIRPPSLDPIRRNAALEDAVRKNMQLLGIPIDADDGRRGSSDIGNLSHHIPVIHPYLAIVDPGVPGHSAAFCEATVSERGRQALIHAAQILAMTAYDYLTSPQLREKAFKDFNRQTVIEA
ncbi:MAG: M20 family metallopeptidase [Thermodesulfobacteriota bacterium]